MDWNLLYPNNKQPTWEQVSDYIDNPLWSEFNNGIQAAYQVEPYMEYSRCSMQRGWNIKYKKSGKSLCTLYPMFGYFIALVVIGDDKLSEAEFLMPLCSSYTQNIFKSTKNNHGQKWLMLEVKNKEIMDDIINLIRLRKQVKNKEQI